MKLGQTQVEVWITLKKNTLNKKLHPVNYISTYNTIVLSLLIHSMYVHDMYMTCTLHNDPFPHLQDITSLNRHKIRFRQVSIKQDNLVLSTGLIM